MLVVPCHVVNSSPQVFYLQMIQARDSSEVSFDRNWTEYKMGFGNVTATHWLGNNQIYRLTRTHDQVLLIVLKTQSNVFTISYSNFSIASEEDFYRLRISDVQEQSKDY